MRSTYHRKYTTLQTDSSEGDLHYVKITNYQTLLCNKMSGYLRLRIMQILSVLNPAPQVAPLLTHLPDLLTHLPDLLTHLPDLLTHFPDLLTHFPDLLMHFPDLLTHLPDLLMHFPDLLMRLPTPTLTFADLHRHPPPLRQSTFPATASPSTTFK